MHVDRRLLETYGSQHLRRRYWQECIYVLYENQKYINGWDRDHAFEVVSHNCYPKYLSARVQVNLTFVHLQRKHYTYQPCLYVVSRRFAMRMFTGMANQGKCLCSKETASQKIKKKFGKLLS